MGASLLSYNPIKKSFLAFEQSERENNPIIIGIEVEQKKDELDVIQHFVLKDLTMLSQYIKITTKANLSITDSNVLSKEILSTGTDQEILTEAYPNLDLNDFYYQILKTSEKSFVAICRKQYVDTLISAYKKVNIQITNIDLGDLRISSLLSYFRDTELLTYSSTILSNNGEISSIESNNSSIEEYKIETIVIPSTHTLPFACILDTVTNQTSISGNTEEKNAELLHTYKESQFFKKTLQYGIGFLLISLLINFFVFNSKYTAWQELQEEQQIYSTQKKGIEKQQSIVNTKEAIVQSIVNTGFSKSSYYIDQIIQSLPTTVTLNSFTYQPIAKTIRTEKPIVIRERTLLITGNSSDKAAFTAWLDSIEDVSFVKATTINYGWDKKNTSAFEIAINLIDDTEK
ncbi:hypothetical protein [uncultured Aquimarina sp.]|uniref:hypothetical protein n=1 Tax=uncultured Aquimarina sp. TaxID=575652 RepID=UPI00260BF8E4|nr:hypothetical protein [uncultured Aquimarina sp.]